MVPLGGGVLHEMNCCLRHPANYFWIFYGALIFLSIEVECSAIWALALRVSMQFLCS